LNYIESNILRKRIFSLEENGVRVSSESIFGHKQIFHPIDNVGPYIQYDKEVNFLNIIVSIVILVIGIKILLESTKDNFLFIIAISFIFGSLYWIINTVFNLEYIGSFYFSNSTIKDKNSFEIKSPYPASKDLELFLNNVVKLQIDRAKEKILERVNHETNFVYLESSVKELNRKFNLEDSHYEEFINDIKLLIEKKKEDNNRYQIIFPPVRLSISRSVVRHEKEK